MLASHYNHSSVFKEKLSQEQLKKSTQTNALVQQIPTRWNTFYYMLERVLKNHQFLHNICSVENKLKKLILNEDELNVVKIVCDCLHPFEVITNKLSKTSDSLSIVVPSICLLLRETESNCGDGNFEQLFKYLLNNKIRFYNKKYKLLESDIHCVATFLNPKTKAFLNATNSERESFLIKAENYVKKHIGNQSQASNSEQNTIRPQLRFRLDEGSDDETNNQSLYFSIDEQLRR